MLTTTIAFLPPRRNSRLFIYALLSICFWPLSDIFPRACCFMPSTVGRSEQQLSFFLRLRWLINYANNAYNVYLSLLSFKEK